MHRLSLPFPRHRHPHFIEFVIQIGMMQTLDWEAHRATIERLYIIENRTVQDVVGIMERTHGFVARSVIAALLL